MKYMWILLAIIILAITAWAITRKNSTSNSSVAAININQEQAFDSIKSYLDKSATFKNGTSTYDLSFLRVLTGWNDQSIGGYSPAEPKIHTGKDILADIAIPNHQFVWGKLSDISAGNDYWVFSWTRPGVIDQAYSFYIDAKGGMFVLLMKYTSPD